MADKQIGTTVWISCRAKQGCPGRQAVLKMKSKLPQGGTAIRYTCTVCKGSFHITY